VGGGEHDDDDGWEGISAGNYMRRYIAYVRVKGRTGFGLEV